MTIKLHKNFIKQYKKLFEFENVELTFTDEALVEVAKKAIERKTGARGLRSILENLLLDTMYEVPGTPSVAEVIIDGAVVRGEKKPVIVVGPEAATTEKEKKKLPSKKA